MKDLILAKESLVGEVTLALARGGSLITKTGRGVSPLLELFDTGADLSQYSAADRVVGLGAAYLYIALGIKRLYAAVISVPAIELLKEYGVYIEYDILTERIINRAGTGGCPIEECVMGASSVDDAIYSMREKLKELVRIAK